MPLPQLGQALESLSPGEWALVTEDALSVLHSDDSSLPLGETFLGSHSENPVWFLVVKLCKFGGP